MKGIKFEIVTLAPSKNITPNIVKQHFNWRKTNNFNGSNIIAFGDVKEPIWWNRPYQSDVIVKQEADGLYSYNLPYIYRKNDIKTEYNLLVNKNSLPLIIQLKMNQNWTADQLKLLGNQLTIQAVYNALIALGVDNTKLKNKHNDLYYGTKKFMGTESAEHGGWFGSASVITLRFSEEEEIFKRLSGKYPKERGICGIIEETNDLFTKEQFIEALIKSFKEILSKLD